MSSKRGRTIEEKITDRFLLIFLIADARRGIGDTKLQKLAFLSEFDMKLQGRKGFNYNFIKLDFGPYSSDLVQDVLVLEKLGLITKFAHKPTQKGVKTLEAFQYLIENNPIFIEKIQQINSQYSSIERDALVKIVHSLKNPERPGLTIHDTKPRHYILKRTRYWKEERAFQLDERAIASLELAFDPDASMSLRMSLEDAKINPSLKYNEVL